MTDLIAVALGLGARSVAGWSVAEEALCAAVSPSGRVAAARAAVARGEDPLGDGYCARRTPAERRPSGATYTPPALVDAMIGWAATGPVPARVIDPGAGSARFLVAAGRRFPTAHLVGVEVDPLAALLARGHLAAAGLASRAEIRLGDYRSVVFPRWDGPTLFVGNPPYVRHHGIDPGWKAWAAEAAAGLGLRASGLCGLHAHFFLATARHARPGDRGCFLTAAEWLDVGYGALVRGLLLGPLGGDSLTVLEPEARPFPDAQATGAIATFRVGTRPERVRVQRVAVVGASDRLDAGEPVARDRLARATRWNPLTRPARAARPGLVALGELCRVHRGQVTGNNAVWIAGPHAGGLPESLLFPTVTRARELFAAGGVLGGSHALRRVVDLPADLDTLDPAVREAVEAFLARARVLGADSGYVARNRRSWWSVGLRAPAPVLATYMARRPPAFVRNVAGARHINIAHGLYPRVALSDTALDALARWLSGSVALDDGRTYAGGLTKFEPREMERLLVPSPEALDDGNPAAGG